MNDKQITNLKKLNKEIWECRTCDFHSETEGLFPYKPDAPFFNDNDYLDLDRPKVITVGINPGWNSDFEEKWKEIYRLSDYEEFSKKLLAETDEENRNSPHRDPYRTGIAKTLNIINKHLRIYTEKDTAEEDTMQGEIKRESIYKYAFWNNLSYCSSQNPYKRSFRGKDIICNTYTEEIPNCLERNYLKKIIKIVNPELVLFFGAHYNIYYKILIKKLFNIDPYSKPDSFKSIIKEYTVHKRGDNDIKTTIASSIINANTRAIFLPHPNCRFTDANREAALKEVCDWITENK